MIFVFLLVIFVLFLVMIVFILLRGDDRVHPALAIQLRSHLTYCLGRAEGSDISLIHPTATAAGTVPFAYCLSPIAAFILILPRSFGRLTQR